MSSKRAMFERGRVENMSTMIRMFVLGRADQLSLTTKYPSQRRPTCECSFQECPTPSTQPSYVLGRLRSRKSPLDSGSIALSLLLLLLLLLSSLPFPSFFPLFSPLRRCPVLVILAAADGGCGEFLSPTQRKIRASDSGSHLLGIGPQTLAL